MSINVATEFTRSGSFAIWESGSFNAQTENGWACLVADPQGLPQHPIFERNVSKSKHHYLFRVTLGSLVVITNIQRMPNSKDLFSARVTVGRVTALQTRPNDKNPTRLDAVSEVQPLWSESFLGMKHTLQERGGELSPVIPGLEIEVLDRLQAMIWESLGKSLTPASEQHMFWGTVREAKPKKATKNEAASVEDIQSPVTGRVSSYAEVSEQVVAETRATVEAETEAHDGAIQADSMSLCGLSSDPLPPLATD